LRRLVVTVALSLIISSFFVVTFTALTSLYGDVNGDGEINGDDLLCLKRYLLDWDDYIDRSGENYKGPVGAKYADVDGNGEVDGDDLICLKRHLLDWEDYIGDPTLDRYKGPEFCFSRNPTVPNGTKKSAMNYGTSWKN